MWCAGQLQDIARASGPSRTTSTAKGRDDLAVTHQYIERQHTARRLSIQDMYKEVSVQILYHFLAFPAHSILGSTERSQRSSLPCASSSSRHYPTCVYNVWRAETSSKWLVLCEFAKQYKNERWKTIRTWIHMLYNAAVLYYRTNERLK